METLRAVVERITFQSQESGYTVIKCRVKGAADLVPAVGTMPDVHVGSVLLLTGTWKVDSKYGRQFSISSYEETLPATVYGIEKYLGSGLVKGIGPKFARKIVNTFGEKTLEIIETEPDRLNEVPGLGRKRVELLKESWEKQREIKNIMLFLQAHDVSTSHAARIFKTYGSKSIELVKENPYRLADEVWGIGFRTADQIGEKLGFGHEKFVRLRGGVIYTLNQLSSEGHCFARRDQLVETGVKLLDVTAEVLHMTLDEMIRVGDVIYEDDALYLPAFYYSELGSARRIRDLLKAPREKELDVESLMHAVEQQSKIPGRIPYDEIQLQAIRTALSSKMMVITGGPGTGKSTCTNGIITAFRLAGLKMVLAAPTGRAAKRLAEVTGLEAKTIHRLLEVQPAAGYKRNEENPIEGDVLILDECSMIDLNLMYALLRAIPPEMSLIMVGDIDQLPSVGAGNVLRDIIDSGVLPVVRLTRIFRQAQGSRIITNAHLINEGKPINLSGGKDTDFFFTSAENQEACVDKLVHYAVKSLPAYYKVDPFRDVQVLTPMQRGPAGAVNLNQVLQKALNPGGICLKSRGMEYRLHDKVMQIRNDYDKEVYNGDIGFISQVDPEAKELLVDFDGRSVKYDSTELDELLLAYATTIHKAQGSEYPIVVMPILMSHYMMLERNLLYTGVTRAKKILLLIGERKAVSLAIENHKTKERNTRLTLRIQDFVENRRPKQESVPQTLSDPEISSLPAASLPESAPEAWPGTLGERASGMGNTEGAENRSKDAEEEGGGFISPVKLIQPGAWGLEEPPYSSFFARLSQSAFRQNFHLGEKERAYVAEKGMDTIREHACEIIRKRLAPQLIPNDGRQTPMRNHPVFIAQHATATCCRECLQKWHGLPKGREMTEAEQSYAVGVIMEWIRRDYGSGA